MSAQPTGLIAEDEPLLREALVRQLRCAWPELQIVAQARNGREAIQQFEAKQPDICFLDVHMPGVNGIAAARHIGQRAHVVFVTAFDQYAVQAFAQGALDYLVKPVEPARLLDTVRRLQSRIKSAQPSANLDMLLQQLSAQLEKASSKAPSYLRWLRTSAGTLLRLIAVDDVDYLRSDSKYTVVAWRGEAGQPGEAVIRLPLKELLTQLDPEQFVQVHRSVVVNLRAISHVTRCDHETADIHLKHRKEVLPVSRSFTHLFKQM